MDTTKSAASRTQGTTTAQCTAPLNPKTAACVFGHDIRITPATTTNKTASDSDCSRRLESHDGNRIQEKKVTSCNDLALRKDKEGSSDKYYEWEVSDFHKKLGDAQKLNDKETSPIAESKTFYTADFYALKMYVDLSRVRSDGRVYLSVDTAVQQGIYDATIPWPLQRRAQFTLVDPTIQKADIIQTTDIAPINKKETSSHGRFGIWKLVSLETLRGFITPHGSITIRLELS